MNVERPSILNIVNGKKFDEAVAFLTFVHLIHEF
jgi:hypothetical protein